MVSTNPPACGIICMPVEGATALHLPLQHVSAHAEIVDVSAVVTLTQTFWQYSPEPSGRAKYVFPIPARAAICAFEMRTESGKVVKAVAKEKEEAKQEHEAALRQGKMTGLVEHVSDDIFTVSLGALPGPQLITTVLTYVLDLMDADVTDQVRFQLPCSVGMRYGDLPPGMVDLTTFFAGRVKVSASIQMNGTVRSIESPSHMLNTYESDGAPTYTEPAARRRITYESSDFLQVDFVLVIKADGLDAPRVFAERHPDGTLAIQLTLVPKFDLPPIPAQEYIFMVDRSGSMGGDRISTAKKTLVMLLRALPTQGTTFNIFSFGNQCDSIWQSSMPYTEQALNYATHMVDLMRADYGGTEIRGALEKVFKARKGTVPTACFLLTDGEAGDVEKTLASVEKAVGKAKAKTPLRVFTLGIGGTSSSAMCEGIARVGNGVCLMAVTSESIIGKCSKLVRASRTYILKDIAMDWGFGTKVQAIRQAPEKITALYSGNRFIVFALIRPPTNPQNPAEKLGAPKQIVLKAKRDGTGPELNFSFPVEQLPYNEQGPHLIHVLAARRIIQELTDGEPTDKYGTAKTSIIQLGTQFQLTSKYTSFVAVDESEPDNLEKEGLPDYAQLHTAPKLSDEKELRATLLSASLLGGGASYDRSMSTVPILAAPSSHYKAKKSSIRLSAPSVPGRSFITNLLHAAGLQSRGPSENVVYASASRSSAPQAMPVLVAPPAPIAPGGGYPTTIQPASLDEGAMRMSSRRSRPVASSQPIPRSRSRSRSRSPARSRSPSPYDTQEEYATRVPRRSPSVEGSLERAFESLRSIAALVSDTGLSVTPSEVVPRGAPRGPTIVTIHPEPKLDVADLVRLQSFNGSFSTSKNLEAFFGAGALEEGKKLGVDTTVWATLLAVAYLKVHLAHEPELLDGLLEKAMEFISASSEVDVEALLEKAKAFVK